MNPGREQLVLTMPCREGRIRERGRCIDRIRSDIVACEKSFKAVAGDGGQNLLAPDKEVIIGKFDGDGVRMGKGERSGGGESEKGEEAIG